MLQGAKYLGLALAKQAHRPLENAMTFSASIQMLTPLLPLISILNLFAEKYLSMETMAPP